MRHRAWILLAIFGIAGTAEAADRQRIRRLNVALQPVVTMISAAVQGKLRDRHDFWRCLRVGASSGVMFHEAKAMTGRGEFAGALVLANVASSMTRNAAAGRHALARIGVTIGPVRTEVSTRFEPNPQARVHLGISAAEIVALARMWSLSDEVTWRDGWIAFRKNGTYDFDGRHFEGYTIGVFPGTGSSREPEEIWRHETVHAIQAMQVDALEPPLCAWLRRCEDEKRLRFFRIEPIAGIFPALNGADLDLRDYTERWIEIEAYRLAQDRKPR